MCHNRGASAAAIPDRAHFAEAASRQAVVLFDARTPARLEPTRAHPHAIGTAAYAGAHAARPRAGASGCVDGRVASAARLAQAPGPRAAQRLRLRAPAGLAASELRRERCRRTGPQRRSAGWAMERIRTSTSGCGPIRSTCRRSGAVWCSLDTRRLQLSGEESDALLAVVNRHVAPDGLIFSRAPPAALVSARATSAQDSNNAHGSGLGMQRR